MPRLGVSGPKLPRRRIVAPAQRVCLWCDKLFNSTGPGHRRCPKCARIPDEYTPRACQTPKGIV